MDLFFLLFYIYINYILEKMIVNRLFLFFTGSLRNVINVSSTNSEQCKLCVHSPLYIINTRLLWKQTIGGNGS
ncbi:Uncharacterised protein [uncultured Prevotella sp.]|nr:Uncharacterised protein [uncultured Prevotella sp.]